MPRALTVSLSTGPFYSFKKQTERPPTWAIRSPRDLKHVRTQLHRQRPASAKLAGLALWVRRRPPVVKLIGSRL